MKNNIRTNGFYLFETEKTPFYGGAPIKFSILLIFSKNKKVFKIEEEGHLDYNKSAFKALQNEINQFETTDENYTDYISDNNIIVMKFVRDDKHWETYSGLIEGNALTLKSTRHFWDFNTGSINSNSLFEEMKFNFQDTE